MARRFGTSYTLNCYPNAFGTSPLNANNRAISGTDGGIHTPEDAGRLYIAPSCYSEVRKVIFWACIRHEYTGTEAPVNVNLRVWPSSTSMTERLIESAVISESTLNKTVGASGLWSQSVISDDAVLYNRATSGNGNTIPTVQFTATQTEGSQMIYQEFDRFAANDADFFNDWDQIAAVGDGSRHIAYGTCVERQDAVDWTDVATNVPTKNPIIVACGFAIVQAPSPNNKTRIYLPASMGYSSSGAINTLNGRRGEHFFYHANEWDGLVGFHTHHRQVPTGGQTGFFDAQVAAINVGDITVTERSRETYGSATSAGNTWYGRSANILNDIVDGDILTMQYESGNAPANMGLVYSAYEITVENSNLMTAFFSTGHGPPDRNQIPGGDPGGNERFNQGACYFDPLFFEDFESERFLETRLQGGILHLGGTITSSDERITLNANLDADVSASVFNSNMFPEVDTGVNVGSQFTTLDADLTTEDPVNLAGRRKMTLRYDGTWTGGNHDYPGSMQLAYVIDVPNTDVVDLGPLFDTGSFDAEGCAATSAGLGDPGVLIITNGSSVPQKFNPSAFGQTGEIEDAGMPAPFEGEIPSTQTDDTAQSPDGGLAPGVYTYRYTFRNCCTGKESDPSLDDITVDTTGNSPAARVTISFAGIRIPGDPQICEICLYRTIEGGDFPIMAKVGCIDISETTLLVDELSDAALDFTNDGISLLNGPMPCVSIVVDFRNRLFGMGDIPNLAPVGSVSVTAGSDIVIGSQDVEWDRCLEGKVIRFAGDCKPYEILRVLPPSEGLSPPIQRLKLVEVYEGSSDVGLSYTLCGKPNRVYFSEPLEPECWPAANFLDVEPGDGDRLMGAVSNFDSLVICKRRKTYVLRFRENPGIEVFVPSRVSSDIGCVGPRTFAQMESGSVWLAERGLALFDGRSVQHIPESEQMNDIFVRPENPNYVRRDRNGRVIDAVGVFYPGREQYLLLLPTVQTSRGCSLMLVWDVKLRNVTLLEFCQEFQSMVVAKDADGNERVYMGDTNGFVWIYDVGDTDGIGFPNATGTVRGDVGFAGLEEATGASILEDDSASFITGGVPGLADLSGIAGLSGALDGEDVGSAGACVFFRRKDAGYEEPWKSRTIYAATSTKLYVTPQWGADTPFDETGEVEYEYMLGPIKFDQLFKPQNYGIDDTQKRNWRQIVTHEIEEFASKVRVDLLPDFSQSDPEAETVVDPVTDEVGDGRIFRMDYEKGRQIKPVGRDIYNFMALRMRNFAPEEPIRLINHSLCVTPRASK